MPITSPTPSETKDRAEAEYAVRKMARGEAAEIAAAHDAAVRASFGQIAGSVYATGTIEAESGAGGAEAALLAAHSLNLAAEAIAKAIAQSAPALLEGARYIMFAGVDRPRLDHWRLFSLARTTVAQAFVEARSALETAHAHAETITRAGIVHLRQPGDIASTAVDSLGAILDLAAKLGSYFMSDYKLGPLAIASGVDDDLLALAVAGRMSGVCYPARWSPPGGLEVLTRLLAPLRATQQHAVRDKLDAEASARDYKAKSLADQSNATALNAAADQFQKAANLFADAGRAFETLVASLAQTDANGTALATKIVDEHAVGEALDSGGRLLFVRLNLASGGYYSQKNLWTGFGSVPFRVMGGAIASYAAVDGQTGGSAGFGRGPGPRRLSQAGRSGGRVR